MASKVAAVVLAAGLSSRMSAFKPLLPLGDCSALEGVITLFRRSGINDIRVVTGHRSDELTPVVKTLGCRAVPNPRYQEGMFTSVTAGVASLGNDEVSAFFVMPVDVPLVRPATIERMLQASGSSGASVIYPGFMGERGHPPLISGRLAGDIVSWGGNGGLRGVLAGWEGNALEVEVADELILRDMDTPDDYQWLRERVTNLCVPTGRECRALLERVLCVDQKIINHGVAVAQVATLLGQELNRAGHNMQLPLLNAAGLLHDLLRNEANHALAGAQLLEKLGYGAVGKLVASHMDIAFSERDTLNEAAVLFLADKLVQCNSQVSLEERFRPAFERHSGQPEIVEKIRRRLKSAQLIQQQMEKCIGYSLLEILNRQEPADRIHAG